MIGITNQGGVGHGYKSFQNCIVEQRQTIALEPSFRIIYFCPDKEGMLCYGVGNDSYSTAAPFHKSYPEYAGKFRKPGAGMLKVAIEQEEPASEIIYVGDRDEDFQAATTCGVKFIWVKDWWMI